MTHCFCYSCLENSVDRGAWWATVCGVTKSLTQLILASQVVLVVKNLPANTADLRDTGSIPGSGRSPGGGHGNPLQYSCLENPIDRRAWQVTVHGITKELDMT